MSTKLLSETICRKGLMVKCFVALIVFCCSVGEAFAQTDTKVTINVNNVLIRTALDQLQREAKIHFVYDEENIDSGKRVSLFYTKTSLNAVLDDFCKQTSLRYEVKRNLILILPSKAEKTTGKHEPFYMTGVVMDETGESIIGATIMIGGTSQGTVTDIDGRYSLRVTPGDLVSFTFVGMADKVVKVQAGKKVVNVKMETNATALADVVVTGYQTLSKERATGSYSVISEKSTKGKLETDVLSRIEGLVAGINKTSSNSNDVVIRGITTYMGNTKPLYVVDGMPYEGDLASINPTDVQNITVLKDAAASSIYGARAAGGVILVTTKRPKGETSFQLNYNNNFAFATAMNLPEQAPLMEYLQAYSDAAGDQFWTMGSPSVSKWMGYLEQYRNNPSSIPTVGDGIFKDTDGAVYYMNEKDLVKNMLETSFQHTHNISMTGGTDKLRYRLSAGFIDNDGVLITDKDKYRRMNVSGFISANVTKWFTQEATFSYAHSKRMEPKSALGAVYSTRLASFYPEGNMPEGISAAGDGLPFFTPSNQIRWSNPEKTLYDNPRIFLKSILKPLKGFEIAFEYTFDKNIYDYSWYTGSVVYTTVQGGKDTTPTNDYLQKKKRYTDYNSINLYGTYDFSLGNHQFKIMAGFNQESSYQETMEALSYGQAVIEVPSLGSGTSTLKATDKYNEFSVRGGFFRVNYNYQDKYLLEVNGRYDGSSKFPKESRYGFFPSVSAGWNIAQEKFMESTQNWLGSLKLRASYGMIGNQNVPAYSFIPTMAVNNKYNGWISNGNYVTAITSIPSLVSRNFTWEKVGTLDIGIDFSMFSNRFTGTFDWYQRNTNGMLAPGVQLPAVVGADAPYQNTADMRTRGWELSFNWRDQIGKVSYRVGFNLSDSKSKIVKYDSNSSYILSSQKTNALTGGTYTFWEFYKGKELGEIWGYETDGYYTVDDFVDTSSWKLKDGVPSIDGYNPRPGDVKFKNLMDDERGTNMISSGNNTLNNPGDRKVIGNETPRYLYGINLGLNYKGFDLSAFLQGTGKRDKWIANTLTFPLYSDFKFIPLYKGLGDYWQPVDAANGDYTAVNPNAEFPRIYGNYGNQGSNYRQSDKYLSDASYLRIKNVTLSYTFPKAWITKISLSQLRAFVSVENLATFSSLPKGIDPETLKWDYPAFRTVSFGLNLTL